MSEVRAHSKLSQQLTLYPALCCHLVLSYLTGQSYIYYLRKCTNFCQFPVVVVVVVVVVCSAFDCILLLLCITQQQQAQLQQQPA